MKLPHIDYVLISHGHYDHLNTKSAVLNERFDPVFVSGSRFEGYSKSLRSPCIWVSTGGMRLT